MSAQGVIKSFAIGTALAANPVGGGACLPQPNGFPATAMENGGGEKHMTDKKFKISGPGAADFLTAEGELISRRRIPIKEWGRRVTRVFSRMRGRWSRISRRPTRR